MENDRFHGVFYSSIYLWKVKRNPLKAFLRKLNRYLKKKN